MNDECFFLCNLVFVVYVCMYVRVSTTVLIKYAVVMYCLS